VFDERCQLLPERRRVLRVQVDLILRALDREPHRLHRRAAVKIVFYATVTFVAISTSTTALAPAYH
jgi:hypothetical protein